MSGPTWLRSTRPPLFGDLHNWALIQADALAFLQVIPNDSVDAVITDPPYGIAFKGESWDGDLLADADGFQAFSTTWAREVRRVLRPGGYLASFGATKTTHRLVAGVEDAGLEIRDQLLWLYSTGVPKGRRMPGGVSSALRPAYEPILLARKPLPRGRTLTRHVEETGLGALDIDGTSANPPDRSWPTNVLLAHEERCAEACGPRCTVRLIDEIAKSERRGARPVSRLFYSTKATPTEREAGCEALPKITSEIFSSKTGGRARANVHPTVKPLDLCRWITRLVAPPGGSLVLDPFTGSGSIGCAAVLEGRQFIGIERDHRYVPIARARLTHWTRQAARSSEPR
ncbi:MAG: site-specific DNA-methyltransferase [Solirubrobacteraceae bacterium]|nr:site-specific DNA-methyltransferase [Solirubrobacteraceae bacterium]